MRESEIRFITVDKLLRVAIHKLIYKMLPGETGKEFMDSISSLHPGEKIEWQPGIASIEIRTPSKELKIENPKTSSKVR